MSQADEFAISALDQCLSEPTSCRSIECVEFIESVWPDVSLQARQMIEQRIESHLHRSKHERELWMRLTTFWRMSA